MSRLELSETADIDQSPMPDMKRLEKRIWRPGPWEVFVRRNVSGRNGGKRWQEVDAQRQVNFPVIEKVVRVVVGASTPQPLELILGLAQTAIRDYRVSGAELEKSLLPVAAVSAEI